MYTNKSIVDVLREFDCDARAGLTEREAARRLAKNGRNEMQEAKKKTFLQSFLEQLADPLIYVLMGAAVVSVILGEMNDAVIIGAVILLNAVVGVVQEGKARRALESLKKLTSPRAVVMRDGRAKEVEAATLVVGDLVLLEAGCQVPADLRLLSANQLKIEEASLTGESVPVEKNASYIGRGRVALGDRRNMAYMSTVVTNGRGEGIVTATGMDTQIGQIAGMIADSETQLTPLQKRLGELGNLLSVLSLGLCAALFAIAILQKRDILKMLLVAISLAVAAVPEGLPAVVTICLALSVTRMVRVHTIVRRLPSVETLGAVSVVCSDKTGTLTQNKMTVEVCYGEGREWRPGETGQDSFGSRELIKGMVLCNDGVLAANDSCKAEQASVGDPMELALLELGSRYGIYKQELERQLPRVTEQPFDSDRKMMSTCHKEEQRTRTEQRTKAEESYIIYTKGAPERILERCSYILMGGRELSITDADRRNIQREVVRLSGEALRTLALARKRERTAGPTIREEQLTFVGLVGMKDPPRPEAKEAVDTFREAGVATVMITGDHGDTALAIGRQLGIAREASQCMSGEELEHLTPAGLAERLKEVRIFARVTPAQKVEIVKGFRALGHIVAMTGDGVNDAPSLKAADIGIAMGRGGTDVAKQASDMILADDNFATIERAIEEGRSVYENIRKSVIFLLSSNLGEIMTMFTAVVLGLSSPLKSSHILWINLITDSLPALALGVDKNDKRTLMRKAPRHPEESLFARGGLLCTVFYGLLIAGASLTAFFLVPHDLPRAQTYAFTVLGMSQLYHAVGMRDTGRSIFQMNHLENGLMIVACAVGFLLQLAVTEVPFLVEAFGTVQLEPAEWLKLSALAALPLAAHEGLLLLKRLIPKKR